MVAKPVVRALSRWRRGDEALGTSDKIASDGRAVTQMAAAQLRLGEEHPGRYDERSAQRLYRP